MERIGKCPETGRIVSLFFNGEDWLVIRGDDILTKCFYSSREFWWVPSFHAYVDCPSRSEALSWFMAFGDMHKKKKWLQEGF